MKKIKFNRKLSLNKETVAKLNVVQMNVVKGGAIEESGWWFKLVQMLCWSNVPRFNIFIL